MARVPLFRMDSPHTFICEAVDVFDVSEAQNLIADRMRVEPTGLHSKLASRHMRNKSAFWRCLAYLYDA